MSKVPFRDLPFVVKAAVFVSLFIAGAASAADVHVMISAGF
jgi:hypothetical protein